MTPQVRYQHRLKAEGRCIRCAKPNDQLPHTRCRFCAARDNAQFRSRRAMAIALGRCQECRKAPAEGYTRCVKCRVKAAERDQARRARKVAA